MQINFDQRHLAAIGSGLSLDDQVTAAKASGQRFAVVDHAKYGPAVVYYTQEEIDYLDNLAASQPPPPPVRLAPLAFWDLLRQAEKLAILQSAAPAVLLVRAEMQGAQYVEQGHPRTDAGIDILVGEGLLTAERAAEVKAFTPFA